MRIINDACLQALGSYDGGRMLFLSFGTAVGSAFVAEGLVLNLDLGRIDHDGTLLSQLLCESHLQALPSRARRKLLNELVPEVKSIFMADYVVLGGGGAKLLKAIARRLAART